MNDVIPVRVEARNGKVRDIFRGIVHSVEGFRIHDTSDSRPAELLILEIGQEPEKEFEVIQSLLNLGTVKEVFLTSNKADPNVLVQALRTGAREFFSQPISEEEVMQALERLKERRRRSADRNGRKVGKVIAVTGSKGGVGTTSIAVNLATSLVGSNSSRLVALIDMNLVFGEVPLLLDIEPSFHWGEIARNIDRLDSTLLMGILHKHTSGVYILPSPPQLEGKGAATPEGMEKLLNLMKSVFDVVVVDAGQTTGDVSLKILEISDTVLLVSILSLPCLANVNRLLKLYFELGYPQDENVKIVVNRYMKSSDVSIKDAENSINKAVFWTLPNDFQSTMSAINQGRVLSEIAPKALLTRNISELAAALVPDKADRRKTVSLFGWRFLNRN